MLSPDSGLRTIWIRIKQYLPGPGLALTLALGLAGVTPALAAAPGKTGDPGLAHWLLPAQPPSPESNTWTSERSELGKQLFFDPRLSMSGQVTCASCHAPERGWADGLPTSVRFLGATVPLASPHLVNVGFYRAFMWDGRNSNLEELTLGLLKNEKSGMNPGAKVSHEEVVSRIARIPGYRSAFERAYPGEGVTGASIAKAVSAFQRSLVSRTSAFDRWIAGDASAMTPAQVRGFAHFQDPQKGACVLCHQPPAFTDSRFHNIGLKSYGSADAQPGRGKHDPDKAMHGAFRTPGLRDAALTAPYFHDGSARTLLDVVEHYVKGGEVKTNLSPLFRPAKLTDQEKAELVAFLEALTSPQTPFVYPVLPK